MWSGRGREFGESVNCHRNCLDWWWAHNGLAVAITGLLLLAIRNEWDLITWIAPRNEPMPDFEEAEKGE